MDSGILNSQFSFESISSKVEFIDILDHYSFNEDLQCSFNFISYNVHEGDRIAVFKLGWNHLKECLFFEWVPRHGTTDSVLFNKAILPKNTVEIYQFCYISGDNNILGASAPIQFCDQPKNYQSLFLKDTSLPDYSKSPANTYQTPSNKRDNKPDEMKRMKDENELLRNTLKAIVCEKTRNETDIEHLKKITFDLQKSLNMQQVQIKDLQSKLEKVNLKNRNLQNDNKRLHQNYASLTAKFDKIHVAQTLIDFDIGELQSLPPFPFAK